MKKKEAAQTRRSLLLMLVVFGLLTALIALPYQFRSAAGGENVSPKQPRASREENLDYYDIRTDKSVKTADLLVRFRSDAGTNASAVADIKENFARGEAALRQKVPTLKIEYNKELRNPEVIAPDILQGRAVLTSASAAKRSDILRNFAKENNALIGMTGGQIDNLKVTADYKNPAGELSFARLEQFIDGVPVFRAEIRAGFTRQNEMFRVVNNLAPALEYTNLSKEFGDPAEAVRRAAGYIDYELKPGEMTRNEAASNDLKIVFGQGDWATTAEKMYFPVEAGVARAAWRVLNWQKGDAYYVIVDAETGAMLYRENITHDQTQAATYNVYANTTSMLKTMANPAPLSPNPINPALGTQGTLQPRTGVTLVGNEAPYTFNNNGWITDNTNGVNGITDGNNAEAGVDRNLPNGVDAPVQGENRVFNFNYTPGAGPNNGPGDDPLLPAYQNGAGTNLFYVTNRFHDETYLLGFTEQARNFQHDNFGRGGLGNDRISAEAQDNTVNPNFCPAQPCVNNANFATPADGGRGRMQMYIWNRMNPDRDGDLDAEIIVHELGHGLFTRLHNGVGGTQAGQMNEGNSDFFAHVMLALNNDPIDGIYVTGGYSTLNLTSFAPFSNTGNYYYGIRRFPKAVMAFTGGPNNRPHNPMTYADIDPAQMNLTNGAFAPAFAGSATGSHDGGEIWSSMLWEVRAKMVQRLGAEAGNKKVLQVVMDGMKVSPSNPTMMQERDAILAAAQANSTAADVADVWAGFAIRGMGFSAMNPSGNTVVEAFDVPNLFQTPTFTVSDAAGNNNGFAEPGETLALTVPLTNSTGNPVTNVTLQVVGGGSANYGAIANGATVSQQVTFTVPANTPCGSEITLTFNVNSSLGATSFTRHIIVGVPNITFTESFDGATVPAFPAGWTASSLQGGIPFVTTATDSDTAPNSAFAVNPTTVGGGTDLTSPSIPITASAATVSFRNRFDTEAGWDGGALEISVNGSAFQDIITAGGRFVAGGYNGSLGAGANNPLANRSAWSGNSGGYTTTVVRLPAAAAGQNVQLKWRFGADDNTAGTGPNPGWNVDTIQVVGAYNCPPVVANVKSRADFDGDGKTDLSVFRPSDTVWYLQRSQAGFTAAQFGVASDVLTPGDYDGDGKTDFAVFRPADGSWYRINSSNGQFVGAQFGRNGDVPQPGDFDGDGKDDLAVWRPLTGEWFRINSGNGQFVGSQFGASGDKPVAGDFDGDGKDDVAVFRAADATWYRINSGDGQFVATQFGLSSDLVAPADYDGDNREDICVFRPSDGTWYRLNSNGGALVATQFGANGDVPVPGDYDGDGRDDQAVFRNGTWYMNRSTAGFAGAAFGVSTDRAIPKQYIP